MAVTYCVALPFIRTEDGAAPGEARSAKAKPPRGNVTRSCQCGAVAFKRAGDPNVGEFSDAVVLKKFGNVPNDLSEQ